MNVQDSETTVKVLANICELTTLVTQSVVGNAVADAVNGEALTRTTLYTHVASNVQSNLVKSGVL